MFRNTLTVNDKYPVPDCENLSSVIQTVLSLIPKTFSDSFFLFLESTSSFKHFENKDDYHSYFITEFTGCERLG